MRTSFKLFQWLLLAGIIGFMVYGLLKPTPTPEYQPRTWNSWDGFMAISYAGVAREENQGDYPTPERLKEHLKALQTAGYKTIRPEDIQQFLERKQPLPDKALFILFENGRKDSFIRATPLLRETAFTGTMAIPTSLAVFWSRFHMRKSELRRAADMDHWNFASMGHRAIERIKINEKEEGNYLSSRIWDGSSLEAEEAFSNRIFEDYELSATRLKSYLQRPVITFVYPYADNGSSASADSKARSFNLQAVQEHYEQAFVKANNPYNGPSSNPYHLNRMRVPAAWSGDQLVQVLASFEPRQQAAQDERMWLLDHGARYENGSLLLATNGLAWLRGSEEWRNVDIRMNFTRRQNAIGAVYARYQGLDSYIRVSVDTQMVRVQERIGGRLVTLGQSDISIPENTPVRLRLVVQGNRCWAWINDQNIGDSLPVSSLARRGRVGVNVQAGIIEVNDLDAHRTAGRYVRGASFTALTNQPFFVEGLLVPFTPEHAETLTSYPVKRDILAAAAQGTSWIPELSGGEPAIWLNVLDQCLADPVIARLVSHVAVSITDPAFLQSLRELELTPIRQHTSAVAATLPAQLEGTSDHVLLTADEGTNLTAAVNLLLHHISPDRIMVETTRPDALNPNVAVLIQEESP